MNLEKILIETGKIDGQIEVLKQQRLAIVRKDEDYAAYLDRTNGSMTIIEFHTSLSSLAVLNREMDALYQKGKNHDAISREIIRLEEKLGL